MPGKGRKRKGRARKGTGAAYEVRPGYWRGQVDLGVDGEGKRIRKSVTGRSQEEVQGKMDEFKQDVRNGLPVMTDKVTIGQHFEDWLRSKKPNVRSATYGKYRRLYENHIKKDLGGIRLVRLDYARINAFYESLDEKGLARSSVADIANVLRMGLEDAVRKSLLAKNPAKLASKRTSGKKEARFLTQQEVVAFLAAASGEYLEDAFILALHTGMRPGELFGLPWDAVDLEEGRLTVRQALHEEDGNLFIGEVKTDASRRSISLSETAVKALNRQRLRQKELRMAAGSSWENADNLVFTTKRGAYLRRTNIIRRDLARIRERVTKQSKGKMNLEGVTLHSFRHTHASLLIFAGEDPKTVQRRLGHENITMTLQTYGHLLPGQDERAADAVDRVIAGLGT